MQIITTKTILLIVCHWASVLVFLLGLFFTSDHKYESDGMLSYLHKIDKQFIDSLRSIIPSSPKLVRTNRLVLVIIDALRDGFVFEPKYKVKWPKLQLHVNTSLTACSISHVEAPTSTIPRIKVDNLIESELQRTLKRPDDWQGLILHHSGIDHIGHVKGVDHPMLMSRLVEMDTAMDNILKSLRNFSKNDDWLFILTGDHGMNSAGSHGGSERDEVSTGAVIISSNPVNIRNKSCSRNWADLPQTQQIDLATFIGIITGVGIPTGSVGVVDSVWLETFWSDDPHSQLLVLFTVMQQFVKLSGCRVGVYLNLACTSPMFSADDVVLFNSFTTEIKSTLVYYDEKKTKTFEPKHKQLVENVQQLLRRIQQKAVLNLQRGTLFFLILGVIGVWLVTIFLWIHCLRTTYTYWTSLKQADVLPLEKMPSGELYRQFTKPHVTSTPWKILVFTFICLLAQSASLFSTTFTYNEKYVWHHYSVSLILLFCVGLMDYGERDSQPGTKEEAPLLASTHSNGKVVFGGKPSNRIQVHALICLLSLLCFDRLILNRVQTAMDLLDKWTNLDSQYICQIFSLLLMIFLRTVAVYGCPWDTMYSGKVLLIRLSPIFIGVMMALIQWEYRSNRAAGNIEAMIINARIMFAVLVFDALAAFLWRRYYSSHHSSSKHVTSNSHGNPTPKVTELSLWTACIHPLSTFALLVGFLVRPSQSVTWILVMVKEVLLSWSIRRLIERHETSTDRDHGSSMDCKQTKGQHHGQIAQSAVWQLIIWLIYFIQGWTTFFQQGSTHSLGTVDVAAAYVGLTDHYIVFCAPLLIIATFGGPIFWQLAYSARSLYAVGSMNQLSVKWLATCKTVVSLLPMTVVVTACLCMRDSSSIWAVYTPKLIYLIFYQLSFVPFQLVWTIR